MDFKSVIEILNVRKITIPIAFAIGIYLGVEIKYFNNQELAELKTSKKSYLKENNSLNQQIVNYKENQLKLENLLADAKNNILQISKDCQYLLEENKLSFTNSTIGNVLEIKNEKSSIEIDLEKIENEIKTQDQIISSNIMKCDQYKRYGSRMNYQDIACQQKQNALSQKELLQRKLTIKYEYLKKLQEKLLSL